MRVDRTWPEWEALAATIADCRLVSRRLPQKLRGRLDYAGSAHGTAAFFQGFAGFDDLEGHDDAHAAGALARILYDERRTFVTQIWEYLATQPRRWFTAEQVDRDLFDRSGMVDRAFFYLRHLYNNGYVDMDVHRGARRPLRSFIFRYRRAKDRR